MSAASILIVDDDRNEVDIALRAIGRSDLDVKVEIARDGVEALAALGLESNGNPSSRRHLRVVFLDIKMPRLNGWEVLRRIREDSRTSDLPVVVLSSSDRDEDIQRSYKLGANGFIVKHVDPRSPGQYLADAARYWVELNQLPRYHGRR